MTAKALSVKEKSGTTSAVPPKSSLQTRYLFKAGESDLAQLPEGWAGHKLGALAIALAWAGLTEDMKLLTMVHGSSFSDAQRKALRPPAILRARETNLVSKAEDLVTRLRPIAAFAAAASIQDVQRVLRAAFVGMPWADQVRAWLSCLWLSKLGRFAEATTVFRSVPDIAPPDEQTLAAYCDALRRTDENDAADAHLCSHATRFGISGMSLRNVLEYAFALLSYGKHAPALELLSALQKDEFGTPARKVPSTVHRELAERLSTRRALEGEYPAALAVIDRELEKRPGSIPLLTRRIGLLYRTSGIAASVNAALTLLTEERTALAALLSIGRLPLSKAEKAQFLDALPRFATQGPLASEVCRFLLRFTLAAGRHNQALEMAQPMAGYDPLARMLLAGKLLPSSRLTDDTLGSGFHIVHGDPNGPVVLAFLGGNGQTVFGLPIQMLDSFLEKRGATVIYCVDQSGRAFLFGLPGVADNLPEIAAHLAAMPEVNNAKRLVTLGVSVGGLPALALGVTLGASKSLVYSAKTIIGRPAVDCADPTVERHAPHFHQLKREEKDVRLLWPEDKSLAVQMHYGMDMVTDRAHALRLADRPGVTLHPNKGVSGHDSLLPAIESGEFERSLDFLLEQQAAE